MYCVNSSIVNCSANSESPVQSQSYLNCACTNGYAGSTGDTCTACLPGSDKKQSKSSCIPCPLETYSDSGSASCSRCPTMMTRNVDDGSTCSCKEGHGFDVNGTCKAFAAGQLKKQSSNFTCSICALNSFSNEIAATECTSCP